MAGWTCKPDYAALTEEFGSVGAVFALTGEQITRDPSSECIRIERDGVRYYVKRYWHGGKGRPVRRWLGRFFAKPRVKAEWQNLRRFARWGIPTAELVAYGLEREAGAFVRGALITRELPGTFDLAHIAHHQAQRLHGQWLLTISQHLAEATRRLHAHHFAHNDLKWRNLLVDEAGKVFFIDCPTGAFWWGPFLRYRIVKDLACLDKVAKQRLSRSQRLRFYLQYLGQERLSPSDKVRIRQIVDFFEGRE
jgi:hypothetical protein